MGSGKKITDAKRPKRIADSGEHCASDPSDANEGAGGGAGAVSDPGVPVALLIPVVQIDPNVHRRASVGEPVTLRHDLNRIIVLLGHDRLGDVGPEHEAEVRHRQIHSGVLKTVERSPNRARILAR